jgi:drug/metabolite transporter (DMT)-like permease
MIAMPLFFIGGLILLPAHDVWAVFWLSPLMVLGLAAWLLKERIGWQRWIGGAVCVVAVWLVIRPDPAILHWTIALPLGMAFCYSLYRIMTRMLREENSLANLFYSALVVFVPLSLVLPYFWEPVTLGGLLPRVFIGLLGYATLYYLDKGYEIAPAAVMAPFSFSQVPFLLLLKLILFQEVPGKRALLGCAILVVAGIILYLYEMRLAKQAESISSAHAMPIMNQLETNL